MEMFGVLLILLSLCLIILLPCMAVFSSNPWLSPQQSEFMLIAGIAMLIAGSILYGYFLNKRLKANKEKVKIISGSGVKCAYCSNEIDINKENCPHCGKPVWKSYVKELMKLGAVCLKFIVIIAIAGWLGKVASNLNGWRESLSAPTEAVRSNKPFINIKVDNFFENTLIDATPSTQNGLSAKSSSSAMRSEGGKKFVVFHLDILNVSNSPLYTNPGYFTVVDNANVAYSYSSDTYGVDDSFGATNLEPNTRTSGWLVFEIDRNNEPTTLVYSSSSGSVRLPIEYK